MENKFDEVKAKLILAEQQIAAIKIQGVINELMSIGQEIKSALASFSSRTAIEVDDRVMPTKNAAFIIDYTNQKMQEFLNCRDKLERTLNGQYGEQLKIGGLI